MALVLRLSFAAQIIAAFVIFVLGYIGLFATLLLVTLLVRVLYELAKWIYTRGSAASSLPLGSGFPLSAGHSDRRIPLSTTHLTNPNPRPEIAFHPALNRRRIPEIVR
jgi:hypothetical protein